MKKIIFIIIKVLVLIILAIELLKGNLSNTFLCFLTLIILSISDLIFQYLNVPFYLKLVSYLFIFFTEILGEIFNLYVLIPYFDNIMHYTSGIIISALTYYFIKKFPKIDSKLVIILIFSLSISVGSIWEIFEYTSDKILKTDMQKDTIILEITSVLFDENNTKPITQQISTITVNNEDYIQKYGGYIDIGLIDTMTDIIMGLLGTLTYIIFKYKKKLIT